MKATRAPAKRAAKKPAEKKEASTKRKPAKKSAAKKSVAKKEKKGTRGGSKAPQKKRAATDVPRKAGPPELPQTGDVLVVPDPMMEDESPSARALLDRRKSADRREYDRRAFPRPEGRRARMGRRTGDDT